MKNYVGIAILLLFLNSCDQRCAVIPPLVPPETGARKVVIEEFTGVRCVNCPDGSAEIENLKALYGENLIAVSIHAGGFAKPYPNQDEYAIQAGKDILTFLGDPVGYPAAVVNRKVFPDNGGDIQTGKNQWAGYLSSESQSNPIINVNLAKTYDSASRKLEVVVSLAPIKPISGSAALTVMITENNIIGKQLTPAGLVDNYKHKHMLRAVLTAYNGDVITENLTVGTLLSKNFVYTLPANFVAENCEIIAFVSRVGSNKEILQADEIKLTK